MIQITREESNQIRQRFPKATIKSTKSHNYLVTSGNDNVGRFLLSLRGEPQPPTRRDVERLQNRFGNRSADPRFRQNRP